MNPVVHFEMPAKDTKRVSNFYASVFGWAMNTMGEDMGNYVVASTTETDEKTMRPKNPGAINGGFYKYSEENSAPSVVIAVDDIEEHMERVKKAGGKILGKPDKIPGVGLYVSFTDTEGNRVSLLQPLM